ncbi:hypothetical protein QTJ16_004252 [Diplocarpon rosae]|uniref:Uncharacterized protein n=1 Tax=Diplocarpon rosae TaxID=946125 RepID=A0AAD9SYJ2_9HELO|nr:hypothetical protein QTJ16_004252 [Diplocarpon rosae]
MVRICIRERKAGGRDKSGAEKPTLAWKKLVPAGDVVSSSLLQGARGGETLPKQMYRIKILHVDPTQLDEEEESGQDKTSLENLRSYLDTPWLVTRENLRHRAGLCTGFSNSPGDACVFSQDPPADRVAAAPDATACFFSSRERSMSGCWGKILG